MARTKQKATVSCAACSVECAITAEASAGCSPADSRLRFKSCRNGVPSRRARRSGQARRLPARKRDRRSRPRQQQPVSSGGGHEPRALAGRSHDCSAFLFHAVGMSCHAFKPTVGFLLTVCCCSTGCLRLQRSRTASGPALWRCGRSASTSAAQPCSFARHPLPGWWVQDSGLPACG